MADNIYIENSAFIQPGGGGGNLQELYGRFPDSAQLTFYRRVAFRLRIYEKFSDDIIKVLLPTDAQNKRFKNLHAKCSNMFRCDHHYQGA